MKIRYLPYFLIVALTFSGCSNDDYDDYRIPPKMYSSDRLEQYLLQNFDLDGDNHISIREARGVKEIDCSEMSVYSLEWLQYFTELEKLNCSSNSIDCFDLSKNTKLKELICYYSSRCDSIDLSANIALEVFEYRGYDYSWLRYLNLRNNINLRKLYCANVRWWLVDLDLSNNKKLEELYLSKLGYLVDLSSLNDDNNKALNVENISSLRKVYCSDIANISSFNFSGCDKLDSIYCENPNSNGDIVSITLDGCSSLEYLNLTGCEYSFTDISSCNNLKELRYSGDIDISKNTGLEHVYLDHGYLISPILNNTKLRSIHCISVKNADIFDLSNQLSLEELSCQDVKPINFSRNKALKYLNIANYIDDNQGISELRLKDYPDLMEMSYTYRYQLSALEVENCPSLKSLALTYDPYLHSDLDVAKISNCVSLNSLYCSVAAKFLDINQCPDIDTLDCSRNSLTELHPEDFPKLKYLNCGYNQLPVLDVSRALKLEYLDCSYNQLSDIDVSKNIAITELHCEHNERITKLDLSHNHNLTTLYCGNYINPIQIYLPVNHHISGYIINGTVIYVE